MAHTHVLDQSIVVFSKNYLPISQIPLRRAIVLLITGRAEPLDLFAGPVWQVRSPSVALEVPSYIRLLQGSRERPWKLPAVNRREVFRRDHHRCQYCGATRDLTIDHVLPLSRGGGHTWENVVAACQSCNQRKGNRTPEEAHMTLKTKPKPPVHPTVHFAEKFWRNHATQGA